jgi:glucan phosphoethanolaminetransferase (alkaline phosphatase superfamily)
MSKKIILGVLIIIFLIISSIALFYCASTSKSSIGKIILSILGVILLIITVIVGSSTMLLENCDDNFDSMEKHITEMYRFSTSYLYNIPESEVVIPKDRNMYSNTVYSNLNKYTGLQVGPAAPTYNRQ